MSLTGMESVDLDQPLVRPVARLHQVPEWLKNPDRDPNPAQSADAAG